MGCLASLRQVPKGSDSPRAVRSMFGLGASEASAAERPVKQNGRQRSGDRRQGRVSERGQREMETELFFFICEAVVSVRLTLLWLLRCVQVY